MYVCVYKCRKNTLIQMYVCVYKCISALWLKWLPVTNRWNLEKSGVKVYVNNSELGHCVKLAQSVLKRRVRAQNKIWDSIKKVKCFESTSVEPVWSGKVFYKITRFEPRFGDKESQINLIVVHSYLKIYFPSWYWGKQYNQHI